MLILIRKFRFILLSGIFIGFIFIQCNSNTESESLELNREEIDSTDIRIDSLSGLIIDEGYQLVQANCTPCHSSKLITQNRASRDGWKEMIVWMQETQNLWQLGENEGIILDYLAKNYAPEVQGRRAPLKDIEWYELN